MVHSGPAGPSGHNSPHWWSAQPISSGASLSTQVVPSSNWWLQALLFTIIWTSCTYFDDQCAFFRSPWSQLRWLQGKYHLTIGSNPSQWALKQVLELSHRDHQLRAQSRWPSLSAPLPFRSRTATHHQFLTHTNWLAPLKSPCEQFKLQKKVERGWKHKQHARGWGVLLQ